MTFFGADGFSALFASGMCACFFLMISTTASS